MSVPVARTAALLAGAFVATTLVLGAVLGTDPSALRAIAWGGAVNGLLCAGSLAGYARAQGGDSRAFLTALVVGFGIRLIGIPCALAGAILGRGLEIGPAVTAMLGYYAVLFALETTVLYRAAIDDS